MNANALLRERRYAEAAAVAEAELHEAGSGGRLIEVARGLVAWKGFFANSTDAAASEVYFRAVFRALEDLAGPESAAAMAAADNLAGLLGSLDRIAEAIALRERVWAHVRGRLALEDERLMQVRDGLAFLYRRAGEEARAGALYVETGICEHLEPVERRLRELGAVPNACGRFWSKNCHIWVCYDAVLDCEGLIASLALEACVVIHDHRGTHDGSERGLVCELHRDGVMGLHPAGTARCGAAAGPTAAVHSIE